MATATIGSILGKVTGFDERIRQAKKAYEEFKNLPPAQRDLRIKAAIGQIKIDTTQIPKYPDTQFRAPADSRIGRLIEPEEPSPFIKRLRGFFRIKERPDIELTKKGERKSKEFLLKKTLGQTLSPGQELLAKKALEQQAEIMVSSIGGSEAQLPATISRLIKTMKAKGVAEKSIPKLIKIFEKAQKVKSAIPTKLQKLLKIKEEKVIPEIKAQIPTEKERGFVTSVKGALPEIKISGQYIPRSTDRLAIKAKNLVKENITAAEKMATGIDDKAIATTAELLKHYDEQAKIATDPIIRDVLYQKAADLANEKARQLTELGRSVQAASILGRLTPEGQIKFAAREIQKYNEQIAKSRGGILGLQKKIPELSGQEVQQITDEMKAIQGMAEGTEKAMRFQKLQQHVTDLVPSPLMKKITAIWKAGLLTGLKTSGLNIFSNISHGVSEVAKDIPATIVDKIVSLITRKRTVTPTLKGILSGGREGVQKGLRYLTTGFDERNIGTKLDYKRINMGKGRLARGLQAYTDSIFRVLGSEDQPFYYAAKTRSIYEQAKVAAINKGLKGQQAQSFINNLLQSPTDDMIRNATFDAEIAVFQNKTALGTAAKKIQEIPGGEIIVPFSRTPSAVAMQILNYSPAGIMKTIFENVGKGRFDQRLFSKGMGRALTGTAVLALGGSLAKKGLLTGARPRNEREQKLWELEGRQANSIKMGGKWRSVQVLGPLGNVLTIGGIFQREFEESGSPSEAMANTLAGAAQSFSQQTFLTGVSNFIDAVSDPARSAEYVAASTLASTIPTIISDIGRAVDTRERRANTILEKFQARIPGLRERLEPQVTVLGEEKETIGNPLEIMADPTRPSPTKSSPLIQELRRLWDAGFKVSPTLLGDKKGYKGLTPQQNTELWKKAGEITNEKISNLIKTEQYQKLPDDQKAKYVEKFVSKAKLIARVAMIMEVTKAMEGEQLKTKLSELKKTGLMTREVFNEYLKLK